MEGLKTRTYLVSGVLVMCFAGFQFTKAQQGPKRDEKFMEQAAPERVGDRGYLHSNANPLQSYRMEQTTYDILQPYGIVCRNYTDGSSSIDAVLIASRDKDSFHDPHLCFGGQGLVSEEEHVAMAKTQAHGDVPVRVARFKSEGGTQLTGYFYKGPYGYRSSNSELKIDIFKYQLLKGQNPEGVFYRFMTNAQTTDEAKFMKFIGEYMDAANQSSKGFY